MVRPVSLILLPALLLGTQDFWVAYRATVADQTLVAERLDISPSMLPPGKAEALLCRYETTILKPNRWLKENRERLTLCLLRHAASITSKNCFINQGAFKLKSDLKVAPIRIQVRINDGFVTIFSTRIMP